MRRFALLSGCVSCAAVPHAVDCGGQQMLHLVESYLNADLNAGPYLNLAVLGLGKTHPRLVVAGNFPPAAAGAGLHA